ncbi:MAG: alpha-glucan family phosphorylase, partial [Alistipes sp.]
DANGTSPNWIQFIKNTIAKVASNFTSNRMLIDYEQKYYIPMTERFNQLTKNHFCKAIEIAAWKNKVTREWDNVELSELISPTNVGNIIELGKSYVGDIILDTGELTMDDIGVELVVTEECNGDILIRDKFDFLPVSGKDGTARYKLNVTPNNPGLFRLAVRIYPKHDFLPNRQDFALVKWL